MEERLQKKVEILKLKVFESLKSLKKTQPLKVEKQEIKSEKIESQTENSNLNINMKNESEIEKTSKMSDKVLKRKVTEDGVSIERVLSAGEASSGFETVSSIDSQVDIEDLDLSSSEDDDFVVTVEVENDLAFQNRKEKNERLCYWKNKSKSPIIFNHQNDYSISEYGNRRLDGFRKFSKNQYRQKNNEDISHKHNRRDRESSEREDNCFRRYPIRDRSRSKNSDLRRSSRVSRRDEYNSRSRRSRSSERVNRSRVSRSPERNNRMKSPSYKGRKTEPRRSRSFDRNSAKSNPKRDSPARKRRKTPLSNSPMSSVWKRLDNRMSTNTLKSDSQKKTLKPYANKTHRKKERTPFLVELERKLQEAERFKNSKKGTTDEKDKTEVLTNVNSTVSGSEVPPLMNQNPPSWSTHMSTQGGVYPMQCTQMPTFSMENLPLVPGPTGLPVHITMTGEQIPHDMDGRRIPLGPNGYYLPLDPTGRLFAHIVSPANQAVPIHMTDDGVLRLPNSEPVPYGPGHQLPVNIDGKAILIGPDSKPLYSCPDLPKEPPFNLLQMIQSFETATQTAQIVPYVAQMGNQNPCQTLPQAQHVGNQQPAKMAFQTAQTGNSQTDDLKVQKPNNNNEYNFRLFQTDISLSDFIQNSSEIINKADLLKKYKKKAREKSEDVLRCLEIEKNLGVNPSKGGVKRSIPMKLSQKKTSRDDTGSSGSDMVLDSNDSDSASVVRSGVEPAKGLADEIVISSDDEQDVLRIDCDNEGSKTNAHIKADDLISKKIQQAIKSLRDKNYKPPAFGRFIISDLDIGSVVKKSPNDSPLLRNRIKLPFLTPDFNDVHVNNKTVRKEETAVNFKFLSQKKSSEKGEKRTFKYNKTYNATKVPVFTFDFSMQCDFTSMRIKNLKSKVTELETEVVRLKNINANLLDSYRNIQGMIEKKDDELRKALLEIQEKGDEIQFLKRSIESQK